MSDKTDDAVRLFFGLQVSMDTVFALEAGREALEAKVPGAQVPGAQVRWQSPAAYHVTLKFLGWTRPEVLWALRDRVAGIAQRQRPFEMTCQGLGAFPDAQKARVLWAGVEDDGNVAALAKSLNGLCQELGFADDARPFHPHVTLARLPAPLDVGQALDEVPDKMFRKTSVDALVLYQSHLKSDGSEYAVAASWPLEGTSSQSRRQRSQVERGHG